MTEPSAISFQGTSGPWSVYSYTKDTSQTTSTAVFYEIDSSAGFSGANGLEFRYVNNATEIHARTDNNLSPQLMATTLTGTRTSSLVVVSGTEVHVWNNTTATSPKMTFTVASNMLWTTGSGGSGGSVSSTTKKVFSNFW